MYSPSSTMRGFAQRGGRRRPRRKKQFGGGWCTCLAVAAAAAVVLNFTFRYMYTATAEPLVATALATPQQPQDAGMANSLMSSLQSGLRKLSKGGSAFKPLAGESSTESAAALATKVYSEIGDQVAAVRGEITALEQSGSKLEATLGKSIDSSAQADASIAKALEQVQVDVRSIRAKSSIKQLGGKVLAAAAAPAALSAPRAPPAATASFGKGGAAASAGSGPTALLLICYNRPQYLQRTLKMLTETYAKSIKQSGSISQWQIIISQDGYHSGVSKTATDFIASSKKEHPELHINHIHHEQSRGGNGYEKLAKHFGWALGQVFSGKAGASLLKTGGKVQRVVILEDDLEVAPDFFHYFVAMGRLLDLDRSILAASAYNDNGQGQFVADPGRLYRSDFFPGLGWMMPRRAWEELGPKWPTGYWDDWLREPKQRQDRAFIRPEVSRTKTFGKVGVSQAQFFGSYLATIKLNSQSVDFSKTDLSYLTKEKYDKALKAAVAGAKLTSASQLKAVATQSSPDVSASKAQPLAAGGALFPSGSCFKVEYSGNGEHGASRGSARSFIAVAKSLGLMADVKANVPRTAYQGVLSFRFKGHCAFLVPSSWD